jgi:hypothetical protein
MTDPLAQFYNRELNVKHPCLETCRKKRLTDHFDGRSSLERVQALATGIVVVGSSIRRPAIGQVVQRLLWAMDSLGNPLADFNSDWNLPMGSLKVSLHRLSSRLIAAQLSLLTFVAVRNRTLRDFAFAKLRTNDNEPEQAIASWVEKINR